MVRDHEPVGDTNDALHRERDDGAHRITSEVRNRCGSIFNPAFFNSAASDGICCGIHIPSAPNAVVAARARIPIKSFFTRSPSVFRWDQIEREASAISDVSLLDSISSTAIPRLTC